MTKLYLLTAVFVCPLQLEGHVVGLQVADLMLRQAEIHHVLYNKNNTLILAQCELIGFYEISEANTGFTMGYLFLLFFDRFGQ